MLSLDVLLIAGLVWQVKHQREYHPARTGDWRRLSDSEVEVAREDEEIWIEKLPECVVPSNLMVCRRSASPKLGLTFRQPRPPHS